MKTAVFTAALIVAIAAGILLRRDPAHGCLPADFEGTRPAAELVELRQQIKSRASQPKGVAALREYGWHLFSSVVQQSPACTVPMWLQWPDLASTFHLRGSAPAGKSSHLTFFMPVGEFEAAPGIHPKILLPKEPIFQAVNYNFPAYRHVQQQRLFDPTQAAQLTQQGTRDISDFPTGAIVVKTFWRAVPKGRPIRMGVWDWKDLEKLEPEFKGALPEENWSHHVCVYQKMPTTPDSSCEGETVTVDDFYSLPDKAGIVFIKDQPEPGAKLILIGMHISTKEIPDWTWTTLWWNGPKGYADATRHYDTAQRPATLGDPWARYALDITVSLFNLEFQTPHEPQKRAMFNPYIEGAALSVKSNCVQCHSQARLGEFDSLNVHSPNVEHFEGCFRTDYMWRIARSLGNCNPRQRSPH